MSSLSDEIFRELAQYCPDPHICANCGESLAGGEHTLPWENGNNPDGYTKCPHCGYVNFEFGADDD